LFAIDWSDVGRVVRLRWFPPFPQRSGLGAVVILSVGRDRPSSFAVFVLAVSLCSK
jgi:hypothetical protein